MESPKIPPISALTALEPRPGGQWTVNEQEGDTTSLTYIMGNGTEAITYNMRQCRTEDDVRKHCAPFFYEYTDNVSETEYYHQNAHEAPTEFRDAQGVAPTLYQSQEEGALRQYSTGQIQQPLQEHLLFNTEATIVSPSESQAQANIMKVIEADPFQAAKEHLGTHYEEKRVPVLGVKSHLVDDLNAVNYLSLQFAYPDPRQLYNYAYTSSTATQQYQPEIPQMGYFGMAESDTIDVDNPWDIDKMLGYQENQGERDAGLPPNNQYNPHNEFYYAF
ncbi:uncharacterized protein Triagg1_3694 [Trichoderma aggressivum f. europaeum]|uniref:Uncharacterized protein n=1 Tax=Trichoderma aggressivum f. europaeum TaxID=173218 RepID=A0AAE1IGW2_9HYPO|nr:hypothetical protein Triagg1_3694 [Trichoderma aggressivum f. europaeum]